MVATKPSPAQTRARPVQLKFHDIPGVMPTDQKERIEAVVVCRGEFSEQDKELGRNDRGRMKAVADTACQEECDLL